MTRLPAEIRELGYRRSANLLVRHLKPGRAQAERACPPPRRLASLIMTWPGDLSDREPGHFDDLLAACQHLTVLVEHVRAFAELLTTRNGNTDGPAFPCSSSGSCSAGRSHYLFVPEPSS